MKRWVAVTLMLLFIVTGALWILSYCQGLRSTDSTYSWNTDSFFNYSEYRSPAVLNFELFPGFVQLELDCESQPCKGIERYESHFMAEDDIYIGGLNLQNAYYIVDCDGCFSNYKIGFPCWAAFLLTFIYPAFYFGGRVVRRRKNITGCHCSKCNYNLTGNTSGTCSECGEAILADTSTGSWRKWATPPTVVECTFLCGISICGFLSVSDPAKWNESCSYLFVGLMGIVLWGGLVGIYLLRIAFCLLAGKSTEGYRVEFARRKRWIAMAVCSLLFVSSLIRPWPLLLRFRLSQKSFEARLVDFKAGAFSGEQWIGLFYVNKIYDIPETCCCGPRTFFQTGGWGYHSVGFEHDPSPVYPRRGLAEGQVGLSWYTYEHCGEDLENAISGED